jgi:signal transduction histidine kinase
MSDQLSDVTLIVGIGTVILLVLAGFVTMLILLYRRRYIAHQTELSLLQETHQREILQAQLETQNMTLQHVADELHDNVGQMLAVVLLQLNLLHQETRQTAFREKVATLLTHTASLVDDVRGLSKSLSTDTVARFGLVACLALEIERINRTGRDEQAALHVLGDTYPMGEQTGIVLLRMVQEGLSNALKHAYGAPITLTLDYQPTALTLVIADEGPGFSMNEVEARPLAGSGQGLHNLRRRASLLGGTCTWQTAPQQGTRVILRIPKPDSSIPAHMYDNSIVIA